MKSTHKILSILAIAAMAIGAGLFIKYLGAEDYGLLPGHAWLAGGVTVAVVAGSAFIPDLLPPGVMAMAITAVKIVRVSNPANMAGLDQKHYYAWCEDILTYPAALTPNFLTATSFGALVTIPSGDPFVMVDGKYFHPFPCTPETGKTTSKMVGPTDSHCFENAISFDNAGNNDPLAGAIAYMANKRMIILGRELNGTLKVIGTEQYPALLDTADRDSGAKTTDGNSIKHSFKAYSVVPCPTYAADVPLDEDEL